MFVAGACPTLLPIRRGDFCYGLFNESLTYLTAQQRCRSNQAHLVWILDMEEQTFIANTFEKRLMYYYLFSCMFVTYFLYYLRERMK